MRDQEWEKQDPLKVFATWLTEAKTTSTIREPLAMALATVSKSGDLSNRVVLLKDFSPHGFIFYTNYNSKKGKALDETNKASAVFYWDPLAKQVRITGTIKRTDRSQSETYWNSRARESQLSQYISHQSERADSREVLEDAVHAAELKFKNKPIPCPEHWGGYILTPTEVEFWEGRPGRLHDRFLFKEPTSKGWTVQRLYP